MVAHGGGWWWWGMVGMVEHGWAAALGARLKAKVRRVGWVQRGKPSPPSLIFLISEPIQISQRLLHRARQQCWKQVQGFAESYEECSARSDC